MVVVTSLGPPEEGIRHKEPATKTYINDKCLGTGTLFVSESRVSWVGDAGHKFSLEYPHIALHAISKDTASFPHEENLYLMIDVRLVDQEHITPTSTPETSDDEAEDPDDPGMTEIRFVPEDKEKLQELFKAMSDCQALHPDEEAVEEEEEQEDEDGGDEGGMFDDAEEGAIEPEGDNGHHNAEEPMEET